MFLSDSKTNKPSVSHLLFWPGFRAGSFFVFNANYPIMFVDIPSFFDREKYRKAGLR